MPDKHVYEYSVIRIVPYVERGECLNVGVILYCRRKNYLDLRLRLDRERILAFLPSGKKDIDLEEIDSYLKVWQLISAGDPEGGPIAAQDPASRFRWLTAPRSTVIQPSPLHPGLCSDPKEALERMFEKYVL